jgi:hypothetical protein
MSLKSYFRKDHKYKTQADLKNMTAEEIVSLNPSDIGFYVENETGGIPLTGAKKRALLNLLARKKAEKESGINPKVRENIINSFLTREGLRSDSAVSNLMVDTVNKITGDELQMKSMENRLRKLQDKPEIPFTNEEQIYQRIQKLRSGGKTKRRTRYIRKTKKNKSYKKSRRYIRK